MRCSGVPNEHHVQDTFVFLPTGTIDRGTPKHDSVGTVLSGSIAHLIRCSPAGEAACIPCPEEAGPSAPEREANPCLRHLADPLPPTYPVHGIIAPRHITDPARVSGGRPSWSPLTAWQ